MKSHKIKYVSVKLPAAADAYPIDKHGCKKLPDYTTDYLKKHAKKLFKILMNKVPMTVYSEFVRCVKEHDNRTEA